MTGPGAFWYNGSAAQVLATTNVTGTFGITVAQPQIAFTGTNTAPPVTGTFAITVGQPAIAFTGTVTAPPITSTFAITVPTPSIAFTGTVPSSAPPAVGGRPHGVRKRAVVHRYPPRRQHVPLDLTVNDLHEGAFGITVRGPRIAFRGYVDAPTDPEEDTRTFMRMALEDEDLVLAYTMAETWLN